MLHELGLHIKILLPALLVGVIVLSTHVPMGQEVLKRGIIFLDLAIAQMAGFGLILASVIGIETHDKYGEWTTQLLAISSAVIGASLLYQFRKAPAKIQEAMIGVMFMLAATGSILLLAKDPHGGERLKEILVGQILWVEYSDLVFPILIYASVLTIWFKFREKTSEFVFYPLFAITITLSTQLVGVYLVFASLIIPALAVHKTESLPMAYSLGFAGYFVGLLLSAIFDFPSGAMVAWSLTVIACSYYFIRHVISANSNKVILEKLENDV